MSSSDVYSEDDDELSDTPSITPRAARGTRVTALKKLRASLLDESIESYTKLLDETFQDKSTTKEDNFNTTQDGVVIWTPQEKRIFFEFLDRKGQNGIREIAAAIQTKSELEVQEFIRLLQKGVRRQHLNDAHPRVAILGDIPAAAEISEACCETLDSHAELLCLEEQRREDAAGKDKYGGVWIISEEVAEKLEWNISEDEKVSTDSDQDIEVQANEGDDGKAPERLDVNDAATFFKVTNWVLLSERLFMNFGGDRLEDNWVNVAFKNETPSMTADVLTNFYEIALSVTRRLVHATHFFASSRVRRTRNASRPSATVVKASDVRRAARTLNMKSDASEYWIGVARRCSLEVEDRRHRKGWNPIPLEHDEVEALLSQKSLPTEPYQTAMLRPTPRERSSSIASDKSLDSLVAESSASEDEHAEALDQQYSAAEEQLCWSALGQPPPSPSSSADADADAKFPIPPRPDSKRKTTEELVDWRDRTLARNEWEEYGYEVGNLDSEFSESIHKKRRLTIATFRSLDESSLRAAAELSESGFDSQDEHGNAKSKAKGKAKATAGTGFVESHTDESDPEFQPAFPGRAPRSKSKSATKPKSRTSSRKRTPVSYALPPAFDLEMEMDVDLESGPTLGLEDGTRAKDNEEQQDDDSRSGGSEAIDEEHENTEGDAFSGSDDHDHPSGPREESPVWNEEVDLDDDDDDNHQDETPEGYVLSSPHDTQLY
ncbi:hypothetical protein BDW74DRAFT_185249 [Aspergillus multicolor]|uniref:uncharacterized protein n=1 Tax=Aspergillus multicolor TaxID=41759 RepID=UPI003CCCBED7